MSEKITVIGPGKMGTGIVQVMLAAGYEVLLIGRSKEALDKGMALLSSSMDKAIEKQRMTREQKTLLLSRLHITTNYAESAGSIAVIEAVTEDFNAKVSVLQEAEKNCGPAILATNTSSILLGKLAAKLKDPSKFLGMHFFNPVPVMKPIELITTQFTSSEAEAKALEIASRAGKTAIKVNDYPGFVANSVLMPLINEAILLLENGVATKEGIDAIVRLGLNHPMGPLELADFIGLDVCKDIMDSIYSETKDQKFKPVKLLVEMVKSGKLGRKSGEGFYKY